MVDILLEFQFAERSGNWEIHLSSFRKMLPYFFAFDHVNYSRWGTIYLMDMYKLHEEALEVHEEFMRGNFVVKRLNGNFNQLSVDQALEHINKTSKDAGGIVGLTKNSTKLDEWFLSYNMIGMMVDEFRASLDLSNHSSSQNVEGGKKRMKIDQDSVQKLHDEFLRFNVFSKSEDRLLVISTNEIASPNVQTSLLNIQKIGEEGLAKFLDTVGAPNFFKPIKKNNLPTLRRAGTYKTVAEKKKIVQAGQEFLQKILAAGAIGRDINYEDVFKHELTAYSMSLAPAGVLSVPSNKSALGSIIEQFTVTSKYLLLPLQNHKTCHIFDGMSLIQAVGKPSNAKTFDDYARILKSIVFKNPYSAKRIDFVLDHYEESSIKNCTR
ncbi:uncharacterized protein [Diabrotica undecimpunctata]|uniref:uncharacterized protein n=1 Tax=Diabrotica undecimpunctata TaxID=50387 RepID=UPI003B63C30E